MQFSAVLIGSFM